MSNRDYISRQLRAIFCLATLRRCTPDEAAKAWVQEGFAVEWANRHCQEV